MESKINEKIFVGGGKSEVLLDEATNEVNIKGVNVVTDQPGIGDILCYDENRKYKFIQLDTFQAGTFPSAWETLGVVVLRKGNQVTVCSKNNTTKKFMAVFPYIVSGYTLDGAEHTATLKLHGKPRTTTYYEFKYTANTVDEFVSQLQQFLSTNGETDWSAYLMDGNVILQYDNYTSVEDSTTTAATGLTLTAKQDVDFPEKVSAFLRQYRDFGNPIWNLGRAKEYYYNDLESSQYNPTTEVTQMRTLPVCWPAFCGTSQYRDKDYCLWLRQKYCSDPDNPKIEEWSKYLEDLTFSIPCMVGMASRRSGEIQLSAAERLKNITYKATDGTFRKLYPAFAYCDEFLEGKGRLPIPSEFFEAFGNVTYGLDGVTRDKADPINRSLFAIGGSAISCANTFFIAVKNVKGTIWIASSIAFLAGSSAYAIVTAVPVARIDLPVD